jgi:hypothetical protein
MAESGRFRSPQEGPSPYAGRDSTQDTPAMKRCSRLSLALILLLSGCALSTPPEETSRTVIRSFATGSAPNRPWRLGLVWQPGGPAGAALRAAGAEHVVGRGFPATRRDAPHWSGKNDRTAFRSHPAKSRGRGMRDFCGCGASPDPVSGQGQAEWPRTPEAFVK